MGLQGKVAIVTGGANGLGRATAMALATAGATVVIADLDEEAATALAASMPERLHPILVDVAEEADVRRMIAAVGEEFGRLDLLVNNAGIQRIAPSAELSLLEWRRVLEVNLTAAFVCAQAAYPLLCRTGGGSIVNVASIAAMVGMPQRAPYTASKAGLIGLTRVLAVEWAADGIRVNAVAPGYILTDMNLRAMRAGVFDAHTVEERTALGRLGRPDEVAAAICWLCDEELSSYVTGTVLTIDGGWSIMGQRPKSGPGSRPSSDNKERGVL
jgi:2-deoxy-D-gluconate 3-dehydrogenase